MMQRIALAWLVWVVCTTDRVSAQATVLYNSPSNTAWLNSANWTGGAVPGAIDIAQFGLNPNTDVGIDMGGATNNGANNQSVGAITVTNARTFNLSIGNSSAATA